MRTRRAMVAVILCAVAMAYLCSGCNKNGVYWDTVLDDYEKLVDQTLALQKRLMANDTSAVSEMQSLNEKYKEFAQRLQGAKGQLTEAQQKRLESILRKYSTGLAER